MKFMVLFFAITTSALLLASCSDPQPPAGIPAELREIMSANRAVALPRILPDFAYRLDGLLTPNLDLETTAQVAAVVRQHLDADFNLFNPYSAVLPTGAPAGPYLSHEEIINDIHFLFDLLRHAYVGYQYFGGDDVFLPLRASMLEQLQRMRGPMPPELYLNQLLVPGLQSAIRDNHFRIHDAIIGAPIHFTYMKKDIILCKTDNDFVIELNGSTYRVIETALPDGSSVASILPTLTASGELAWVFGRIASGEYQSSLLRVLFENVETGALGSRYITLHWVPSPEQASRALLETRVADGVTVVENRQMLFGWADELGFYDALLEFYQSGYESRESPVVVLDLRGHLGGMANLAFEWVRGFAGRAPICEMAFLPFALGSPIMLYQIESFGAWPDRSPTPQPRWERHFHEWGSSPEPQPRWLSPDLSSPCNYIRNDNLVIVLMDHGVSSAGEKFIGYLRQLENVLFVGTNTIGAFLASNIAKTTLPHSGLDIVFGMTLNLRPDLSQFEGVGFLPDLWVPPGESLERVLAFIERYGLNR